MPDFELNRRDTFLPFCLHWINEEEEKAVLETLRSSWITTGPATRSFETEFANYVGAPYSTAVTSCTAGLFMVYQALGISDGDEVIVPAITWPATANAAALLGAKIVFADVDYDTLCVTADTLKPCINERTKAVSIVHFAGLSCDMDPIVKLCKEKGIPLIEDSAHSIGTQYKGKHVGGPYTFASVYSFHPIKNMTTSEGGMITCHDKEIHEKLALYKFHGISRDAWKAYSDGSIPMYDLVFPALKFNQTDILSSIGRVQLKKVNNFNRRRTEIAAYYLDSLKDVEGLDLPANGEGHAWHLFVIKVNDRSGITRIEFIQKMKELNVGTGIHFLPVNTLSYYKDKSPGETPQAIKAGESCVSLPLYPLMTDDDVEYVVSCVKNIFRDRS